jgi:hypothetical protein
MLENTERAIKRGQSREYRKGNQERTIQRIPKGQSKKDNPENTERIIQRIWQHRQDEEKQHKKPTQYVLDTNMRKQTQLT